MRCVVGGLLPFLIAIVASLSVDELQLVPSDFQDDEQVRARCGFLSSAKARMSFATALPPKVFFSITTILIKTAAREDEKMESWERHQTMVAMETSLWV